jgi:hypothetical protein
MTRRADRVFGHIFTGSLGFLAGALVTGILLMSGRPVSRIPVNNAPARNPIDPARIGPNARSARRFIARRRPACLS